MKRFLCAILALCLFLALFTPGPCHAAKKKILVVFSAVDFIALKEGKTHQTGFFLSELAVPLKALTEAGYQVECANPSGDKAVADRSSVNRQFFKSDGEYKEALKLLDNPYVCSPEKLSTYREADLKEFAGIFLPGGHAPMEDLYRNKQLGYILRYFHKNGRPTALICHAPVALLAAKQGEDWIYRDYAMTAFSNQEEEAAEKTTLGGQVQFYICDALEKAGAKLSFAPAPWQSHVVRDRELITGQNPASAEEFVKVFLEALKEKK